MSKAKMIANSLAFGGCRLNEAGLARYTAYQQAVIASPSQHPSNKKAARVYLAAALLAKVATSPYTR